MKCLIIIIALLMIISFGNCLKNWKVYTNTTHIYDVTQIGSKLYIASWGGLEIYNLDTEQFEEKYTTIDGLTNNEIRSLEFMDSSELLLIGTRNGGVNLLSENDFIMPINEIIGLASDRVNKIVHKDSLIFIATKEGISVFTDNPEFPFPFLVHNYTIENGLSANNITSLQISENDYLYCGSEFGLDYVHIDSMNVLNLWNHLNEENSILPSENISSIYINENMIAIGTDSGVIVTNEIQNPESWTIYKDGESVFPVYLDSENSLWFSYGVWDDDLLTIQDTSDFAITRISENGTEISWQENESGLTTSDIMGFEEINGQICAFTWGEGVFVYDGNDWSSNIKADCIIANLVTDVEVDKKGKIWVSNGYLGGEVLGKGTKGISSTSDGQNWENITSEAYPLLKTNNVLDIEVDVNNKKWFACWQLDVIGNCGLSIYDDQNDNWEILSGLTTNYVTSINKDNQDRMWVSTFNGCNIVEAQSSIYVTHQFEILYCDDQKIMLTFIGKKRIYFGSLHYGLQFWDDTSDPETNGVYWGRTPFIDLHAGQIFDIDSREIDNKEEIWIAASTGLFMFDGEDWFLYGTHIKKKVWWNNSWFWDENNPNPEYWYYEGQERLYGSEPTFPTALFVDPFGLIWIGTKDAGITVFDTSRDKFTNYTTENSPLISNTITTFSYEPTTGTLYIGTNEGLNSVEIGISVENNLETELYKTIAYPNPFYPDNGNYLRIENVSSYTMPKGDVFCHIYDLNGELVIKLSKDIYEQFSWDGKNKAEKECSSGIYFYVVSTSDGQVSKGKIILIR